MLHHLGASATAGVALIILHVTLTSPTRPLWTGLIVILMLGSAFLLHAGYRAIIEKVRRETVAASLAAYQQLLSEDETDAPQD